MIMRVRTLKCPSVPDGGRSPRSTSWRYSRHTTLRRPARRVRRCAVRACTPVRSCSGASLVNYVGDYSSYDDGPPTAVLPPPKLAKVGSLKEINPGGQLPTLANPAGQGAHS